MTWIIFGTVISSERIALKEKKRINKGRERGGEGTLVTELKLVRMTAFETAFSVDNMNSSGAGN